MQSPRLSQRKGFTLIELLLVIGIIAILAAIVIVAINPTRQLGQARDAQRRSDVNTILNAVYQHAIDYNGTLPGCLNGGVAGTGYHICAGSGSTQCNHANACDLWVLVSSGYLVSIPTDPQYDLSTDNYDSQYDIQIVSAGNTNRVSVSAPDAEQTSEITVQR